MLKENLKIRNRQWISEIYAKMLKKYKGMRNIGYYRDIFSTDDLIADAYVKFCKKHDIDTMEFEYDHLYNLFNMYIYRQQTVSFTMSHKRTQVWQRFNCFSSYPDEILQGIVNSNKLAANSDNDMYEIKSEIEKPEYQLLKMSLYGYTGDEIGFILGFSHSTINTYVKRQKDKLKQKYFGSVSSKKPVKINKYYNPVGDSKRLRAVLNTETGESWKSAKSAYNSMKNKSGSYNNFTEMLRGGVVNKTKFRYV